MKSIILVLSFLCLLAGISAAPTTHAIILTVATCSTVGCPTGNSNGVAWLASPNNTADWQVPASTFYPSFTIAVGDTISFILGAATPSHPLAFCDSSVSTASQTCATSTTTLGGSPITAAGSVLSYTFTTAGKFYYGCHIHNGMGNSITVGAAATEPICQYYTRFVYGNIFSANEAKFITLVVNMAVLGSVANGGGNPVVAGLLDANGPTRKFFNGSSAYINRAVNDGSAPVCNTAPCTINFETDTGAFGILASHLISFFGTALGCNGSPGFLTAATAGLTASMYDVHKLMGIDNAQMQYFVNTILMTVENLTGDSVHLRTGDAATVQGFLNGFNRGATDAAEGGMGLPTTTDGQAICTAADCPLAPSASTPSPASPTSSPGGSAYTSASTSIFVLLVSAAAIAVVALC